ncbi:hypothetical protein [Streptomyces sp. NPDC056045]|uniref:hypothetical protein n=1 Tax=Streptomyces sp. NPDC056045 TaxID=3345691 RepID=UPI0035DE7BB5
MRGIGTSSDASAHGTVRVRDVVRDVVAEVAPEESPVVEGLARFDDAAVVRLLGRRGGRREPLGFGLGEIAVIATPVVWLVVDQTAQQLGSAAAGGVTAGVRSLLGRIRRRPVAEATVPPLTPDQLAEVHRQVREAATGRGFERERAEILADAVLARLMLRPARPEPETEPESETDGDGPADGGADGVPPGGGDRPRE